MESRKISRPIGGLTREQSQTFANIVLAKVEEREKNGYSHLCDSDVMDIISECELRGIPVTRRELELVGFV